MSADRKRAIVLRKISNGRWPWAKNPDNPTESSEKRAERMWRNNQIRQKIKDGKAVVPVLVYPEDIDYVNRKVKVDKDPPPEVATVIANKGKRKPVSFERKFSQRNSGNAR